MQHIYTKVKNSSHKLLTPQLWLHNLNAVKKRLEKGKTESRNLSDFTANLVLL